MDQQQLERLRAALGTPSVSSLAGSRRRVETWFAQTAPRIQWDVIDSPLGPLYVASSERGLCRVDFGVSRAQFVAGLDALARTVHSPSALASITEQLHGYFAEAGTEFDVPLDLSRLTPFQRTVLQTARRIVAGTVWSYGQVARALGKPGASQAVGQALGRNPVPIVIPCHRVVSSDGGLGGYSGGGGVETKRLLLQLEGAL